MYVRIWESASSRRIATASPLLATERCCRSRWTVGGAPDLEQESLLTAKTASLLSRGYATDKTALQPASPALQPMSPVITNIFKPTQPTQMLMILATRTRRARRGQPYRLRQPCCVHVPSTGVPRSARQLYASAALSSRHGGAAWRIEVKICRFRCLGALACGRNCRRQQSTKRSQKASRQSSNS